MIRFLLPLFPLFFCALVHAQGERIPYACDDGSRFAAEFMTGDAGRARPEGSALGAQATLFIDGREITLPLVPAASGALYRDGDLRFHTKGDDALFEDGKHPMRRCTRGEVPQPSAAKPPSAPSSFVDITGSVAYRARIALPPDAVLVIRVQDTSRADAPARTLAEQRIELAGLQVPIPFRMTVDRDLLRKNARITVAARIQRGSTLLFISDTSYPALIDGQPRHVEMVLKQVGQPARRP
jgi:putative lipoprotein